MNKLLFVKTAVSNINKNRRFYVPYLLTIIGSAAMFYIMCALALSDSLKTMPGAEEVGLIMRFGVVITGILAVVFLFYTNSFLIKRRTKEFGLYNILGMEKRHIGLMLTWETLIVGVSGVALGVGCGILFEKLAMMFLYALLGFDTKIKFELSTVSLIITLVLFAATFCLILISNIIRIGKSKPAELLQSGNVGEKEPKTKRLLAVIGLLCLGGGYYISISNNDPILAIGLFFVAVLLVIIGTYCLFTAGSVALLKFLRNRKKYYYQTRHFTAVSGMIYRMKQNAVGLANICILSTMVLVMISTTASLYFGIDDVMHERYPYDIMCETYGKQAADGTGVEKIIMDCAVEQGRNINSEVAYRYISFTGNINEGGLDAGFRDVAENKRRMIIVVTDEDYMAVGGHSITLNAGEIVLCGYGEKGQKVNLCGQQYTVKSVEESFPPISDLAAYVEKKIYVIVPDVTDMKAIEARQTVVFADDASHIRECINLNVDGTDNEKIELYGSIRETLSQNGIMSGEDGGWFIQGRQYQHRGFYSNYGGFLFLGLFLGLMMTMATVLIIYYKQVSEGYDDKRRFEIMQNVGMNRDEVKRSIGSQIIVVFFLPLAVAAVHLAAAFNMIKNLLKLFALSNVDLYFICALVTVLLFGIIYAAVYLLTARTYYKIVK